MSALTLSSFTRAIQGQKAAAPANALASVAPAQKPASAPVAAPVAPAPAKVEEKAPVGTPATPVVQVETKSPAVAKTPATITTAPINQKDADMGKKEDLLAKRQMTRAAAEEADREYQALLAEEKESVIERIKSEMVEYGITTADLNPRTPSDRSAAERRAGKGTKRGPAPVKFKNPATGETWSGRGQKPRWLVSAEAGGKKVEDFAV